MRILYVTHDFLPGHPSGTEIYTGELAKRVAERGHDVHVFTTEKDIARPHLRLDRREWDGIPVYELVNNLFYAGFAQTWDWPPAAEAFGRLLDALAPDVVHVMHLLYLSIGCVEEAARRGIPVLYTLHDFWLQCPRFGQRIHADGATCTTIDFARCGTCLAVFRYAQPPLARRVARAIAGIRSATGLDLGPLARGAAGALQGRRRRSSAPPLPPDPGPARAMEEAARARDAAIRARLVPEVDLFLAPSRFLRERFVEWGIPAARIEHLSYGLELDPYRGFRRLPAARTRVAFLGTLAPHKGPHLLLEAWAGLPVELRARGECVVYGPASRDPAYAAELTRLARSGGARLGGELARDEVVGALQATDLLVVPSTWFENSPLVIHEARATRTPLLVSDHGGMAELVAPGRDGWRFPVGDAAALRAAIAAVLREPERLARLTFEGEPVKDMRTSAAEMEERYVRLREGRP
ncbi:MAG: glycosyltransferase [Planctomycetota bacterium]